MFKLFKRFLAYFIDMMVVLIIAQTIISIPFVDKKMTKYNDTYNDYLEYISDYSAFRLDLIDSYEDEKIDKEEYDELIEEHDNYKEILNTYYKDESLTKKNYDKLIKRIDNDYEEFSKKMQYKIDKYSIIYNVSYLVLTLLYFVGFNIITGGVTLGKKLMRLKIVNNLDSNKNVSLVSYLIRFVLLYKPIYYLTICIGVNLLNVNNYYNVISVVKGFHTYLEFVILIFMMVRLDGRGLHDILSKTKVVALDRFGNEIKYEKKQLETIEK